MIPVMTEDETEAQQGHVTHLRVTSGFKESKAALPSATLALGFLAREGGRGWFLGWGLLT